jgi:hypothetical protein
MTTRSRLSRLEHSLDSQRMTALRFLSQQAQRPHTRLSACVDRQRVRAADLGVTEPDDPRLQQDPEFTAATTAMLAECLRLVRARWPLVCLYWRATWPEQHPCLPAAVDLLEAADLLEVADSADADTTRKTPGDFEAVSTVSASAPPPAATSATVVEVPSDPGLDPGEQAGDAESEW